MGYSLFLISLLVSTFYYFRTARKFESFNIQLTDELQREMNGLILDFNQTASQNVSILEDRLVQGKELVAEISEQLGYLKKLRDGLGEEVRELQKQKLVLQNQVSSLASQIENSSAASLYERVKESTKPPTSSQSKKREKTRNTSVSTQEVQDILDFTEGGVLFSQTLLQGSSENSVKNEKPQIQKVVYTKKTREKNLPIKEKQVSTREQILGYSHAGKTVEDISKQLNIPKGEVELVIRLFQSVG